MILVIDDDRTARRALRRVLNGCGHSVLCAAELSVAMEILRTAKPRLVLVDGTAEQGGPPVLATIRSDPEVLPVPVVVYNDDGEAGLTLNDGTDQGRQVVGGLDGLRRVAEHFDPVTH